MHIEEEQGLIATSADLCQLLLVFEVPGQQHRQQALQNSDQLVLAW
jgi:hypothetical protein